MGSNTATAFRDGVSQIERIDDDIEALKEQVKAMKDRRKGMLDVIRIESGIIPKVTEQIIRERKMDPVERMAFGDQLQFARAIMGDMLDGTPLGEGARRLFEPKPKPDGEENSDAGRIDHDDQVDMPFTERPALEKTTQDDLNQAWQDGVEAARAGKPLTDNPCPSSKPLLRAQFDQGWCYENGSDGMNIDDSLLPKKPRKKDSDDDRKAA